MRPILIAIGNFLFKHRNLVFPLIILAAFITVPPRSKIFDSQIVEEWTDVLAITTVLAGLSLRGLVLGFHHVRRGGLARSINAGSLYEDGMFGVCRNPLYVGNLLIYSGVFMMNGDWRVVLAGIAIFVVNYVCIVLAEEDYLRRTFGEPYANYCERVPRWTFKVSEFGRSTAHMKFSLKQALLVDYNPIANAVLMLTVTQIWEILRNGVSDDRWELVPLFMIVGLAIAWVISIRLIKKRVRHAPA